MTGHGNGLCMVELIALLPRTLVLSHEVSVVQLDPNTIPAVPT
jgi:hypothetical protein